MKKILLILLFLSATVRAADTELQDLAELVAIAGTDVLYVVDDPAGVPASRKITATNLFDMIDTSAELLAILTNETGTGAAVFANTPTLVTPVIGAATGTSLAATTFLSTGADAADAGAIRLSNAEVIGWEDATEATITHVDNTGWVVNLEWEVDGTLDADGAVTLGDNGETVVIDSSDWDINATGVATGLGAITSDGAFVTTANAITLGDTAAGDPVITFDSGNDGTITWEEDGEDWEFTGDIEVAVDLRVAGATNIIGATTLGTATSVAGDLSLYDAGTLTIYEDGDNFNVTLACNSGEAVATLLGGLDISATFTAGGIVVLGDGGDNFSIASDGIDIATNGNITNAGTIGSGAIVSTGSVTGTSLVAGSTTGDGTVVIHDDDGGGDATVTIQALDATGAAYTLTLPPDDGDDTEVLKTNGAGVLDWVANAGGMTSFQAEDGDGTEVAISNAKEWKFIDATGIDINWTDTSDGTDADPYDLTFTVSLGDSIAAAEMADEDHGDMTWSGGAGTVQLIAMNDSATSTYYVTMSDTDGAGASATIYSDTEFTYTEATGTVAATEFSGGGASVTSVDAITGDSATAFFDAGTIEHEYGGLEADINAYTGLVAITGGSTAEVDDKSELEGHIADVSDFAEADGDTYSGTHDFSSATFVKGRIAGETLVIFKAVDNTPPATIFATFDTITGTSTPAEAIPVLDFDAASSEYADFYGVMPSSYIGTTGITVTIYWVALGETTTTDECRWEAAFRAIEDDAEDLDTTVHTYVYNGVTAPPPATAGEISEDDITFTDGADMDNVDAGDGFILRIYRDHDHADDDCAGDASLLYIHIKET